MSTDLTEMQSVMLPMIRKVFPKLIANEILGVQPMGNPYNTKYWPYVAEVPFGNMAAVEKWCWQNFKGRHWRSRGQWIAFKREQDYAWYKLKWGEQQTSSIFDITSTTINAPSRPLAMKWRVVE